LDASSIERIAAPFVIQGIGNYFCVDWVALNIAAAFQKVGVVVNRNAFEAILKNVADVAVFAGKVFGLEKAQPLGNLAEA
jgi:hypothetical protein